MITFCSIPGAQHDHNKIGITSTPLLMVNTQHVTTQHHHNTIGIMSTSLQPVHAQHHHNTIEISSTSLQPANVHNYHNTIGITLASLQPVSTQHHRNTIGITSTPLYIASTCTKPTQLDRHNVNITLDRQHTTLPQPSQHHHSTITCWSINNTTTTRWA